MVSIKGFLAYSQAEPPFIITNSNNKWVAAHAAEQHRRTMKIPGCLRVVGVGQLRHIRARLVNSWVDSVCKKG